MKLLVRNIAMTPFVIVLRTIPGMIGYAAMHIDNVSQDWLGVCDHIGIYWKRKGD